MFTFCPHCATVFAVKADHLHAAGGQVRCGHCKQQYSVVNYLFEEITAAQDAATAHKATGGQVEVPDAKTREVERLVRKMEAGPRIHQASGSQAEVSEADSLQVERLVRKMEAAPRVHQASRSQAEVSETDSLEVERLVQKMDTVPPESLSLPGGWQERRFAWHDVISGIGVGLLILLLGIQWLYFNRTELANDTVWRPTMERFCDFLDCNLPLRTDHVRVELLERDVRKHPHVDNALLVNVTLVNHADHTQPFPVFSLSFSDISGNPVAMRHFRPDEYLGETTDIKAGMTPESRVQAVLEIEDPGEDAISFQIDFL
ncbi:MAG: zinc-ribbon and DUF3426 domain-containing protein [Gammaproteobacteria bacterium]|nr:MAG: zinc-ribbon and DUF3426 domain-containing protein [Gammaproteobacteria bacterium]